MARHLYPLLGGEQRKSGTNHAIHAELAVNADPPSTVPRAADYDAGLQGRNRADPWPAWVSKLSMAIRSGDTAKDLDDDGQTMLATS